MRLPAAIRALKQIAKGVGIVGKIKETLNKSLAIKKLPAIIKLSTIPIVSWLKLFCENALDFRFLQEVIPGFEEDRVFVFWLVLRSEQ